MEIKVEQRSSEWFDLRKKHIGGSDVAPILGISPWKTALNVFNEKMSPHIEEAPKNSWMQRGVDLEPEALRAFEDKTGYLMSPKVIISDLSPFAMASFDGFDAMGDKVAVEIKCGGDKSHLQALHGQIPNYYYAQMQHQIYVAELDEIYFCSYRPEHVVPLYIEIVKRDDDFIADMIEKERKFYEEHMLTGIPPENPKSIKTIENEQWKILTQEYKVINRQQKWYDQRLKEIQDQLVQIAQSENAKGNGIILQKTERKGIIDYKNIPELKTIDLEKFRKPGTTYWQVKEELN